jgi:hypothetical protein
MGKITQIVAADDHDECTDVYRELFLSGLEHSRRLGIKHLSCQIDAQDTRGLLLLQELGFAMMDTIVVYLLELERWKGKRIQTEGYIREYRPADLPALKAIAKEAFAVSGDNLNRFISDPHLPDERCGRFYEEWLVNSCNGSVADVVLVAEQDGEIVGFTTGRIDEEMSAKLRIRYGSVPLSAVSTKARHKGIYTALARAMIVWMLERADVCESKTQVTTVFVQQSYHKFGRTLIRAYHTFRKWFGNSPPEGEVQRERSTSE